MYISGYPEKIRGNIRNIIACDSYKERMRSVNKTDTCVDAFIMNNFLNSRCDVNHLDTVIGLQR